MVKFTDEELVAEFSDLGVDIDKDDILDKCKREYTVFKHNFDHLTCHLASRNHTPDLSHTWRSPVLPSA